MSNYNFSPTLDGLNNVNSDNVESNNVNTDYLTVNIDSSVPTKIAGTNNNTIASTAFVQNAVSTIISGLPTLSGVNNFTNINTFQSSTINTAPLQIKSTYLSSNNMVSIAPYVQAAGYNPIVQNGDSVIFTDNSTGLVIGPHTSNYSGFRCDLLNTYQYGKTNLSYYVWDSAISGHKVIEYTSTSCNLYLPFYSNYVDPTSITIENQFLGDMYVDKGVNSKNGFYVKDSPITGSATTYALIDSAGNIQNNGTINSGDLITSNNGYDNLNGGISTFSVSINGDTIVKSLTLPNTTSPKFVVDSIGNINYCNTFSIPNTTIPLFKVNSAGDLNYCNTINIPNHLSPLFKVDNVGNIRNCNSIYIPDSTTPLFKVGASGDVEYCKSLSVPNSGAKKFYVDSVGNVNFCNSLYIPNNTSPLITLNSSGNINATTMNTTTAATADNSTLVATTAFVKNQGYITTSALSNYAQLSGVPQTFANINTFSNNNTFSNSNTFSVRQTFTQTGNLTYPILWRSNNATATTRQGYLGITTTSTNFNPIALANDCVIMAADSVNVDVGVLTLTTHSNTSCGIRITNNTVNITGTTISTSGTFQANNALTVTGTTTTNGTLSINNSVVGPTTSYATTSANIGYVNTISSFTTPSGTGINILGTYIFDNASNYSYGTYQIISNIRASPSTAGLSIRTCFTTVTTAMTGLYSDSQATITVGPNILKTIATLKIYSTQTWYLLFQCASGFTFNGAACSIDIIRIA